MPTRLVICGQEKKRSTSEVENPVFYDSVTLLIQDPREMLLSA